MTALIGLNKAIAVNLTSKHQLMQETKAIPQALVHVRFSAAQHKACSPQQARTVIIIY